MLLRPKIRRRHGLRPAEIGVVLTEIAANGSVIDVVPPFEGSASKGGDDHLWRMLEADSSALLVTGDRRLIEKPPEGFRVVTPRAFAERLGER